MAGTSLPKPPIFLMQRVFGTTTKNARREPMKNKKPSYKRDLLNDLRNDREYAAMYLSAAIKDSPESFLVALRDVAEAERGIGKLARAAGVNRENLYRIVSRRGNPRLSTLVPVLEALGLSITVEPLSSDATSNQGPAKAARQTSPTLVGMPKDFFAVQESFGVIRSAPSVRCVRQFQLLEQSQTSNTQDILNLVLQEKRNTTPDSIFLIGA